MAGWIHRGAPQLSNAALRPATPAGERKTIKSRLKRQARGIVGSLRSTTNGAKRSKWQPMAAPWIFIRGTRNSRLDWGSQRARCFLWSESSG